MHRPTLTVTPSTRRSRALPGACKRCRVAIDLDIAERRAEAAYEMVQRILFGLLHGGRASW